MMWSRARFAFKHRGHCPICDKRVTFRAANAWFRDHLLCDACGSIPRERALMQVITDYYPNWRELSVHEASPVMRGASARLSELCPRYSCSYYDPDVPPGQPLDAQGGSRCENLEQLTFPDASFDLFISQDVMEHVFDSEAAFREIARVLKPGGAHIFTVPLMNKARPSEARASRGSDGGIIHHHEPEYHGNPTSASGSLVTMHWGYDLASFITAKTGMPTVIVAMDNIDRGIRAEYIEVLVSVKVPSAEAERAAQARLTEQYAAPLGVIADVHPDDFIFRFLFENSSFERPEHAVRYYFEDGQASARKLSGLLAELGVRQDGSQVSMLEFASGYGCVTRHLHGVMPGVSSLACDIHDNAVEFIRDRLHADAMISCTDPDAFDSDQQFDIVFALSFFSHMPRRTWGRWLRALYRVLKPGGVLIFTTHGRESLKHFGHPDVPADGFYFLADSEQKDLDVADYGQTLVTQDFVRAESLACLGKAPDMFREAFWWKHQDIYVIRKDEA